MKYVFSRLRKLQIDLAFDENIGQIVVLDSFSVFKRRPRPKSEEVKHAEYVGLVHEDEDEYHLGLQLLITGILSAYYDETRQINRRPGFTSFESGRKHDMCLGKIEVKGLRAL